ncbi:hypothetical protein QUA04_13335 [Microcoleus sp. S13_C5]
MGSIHFSFRYYIEPGVWRFFHTIAEIVEPKRPEQQKSFFGGSLEGLLYTICHLVPLSLLAPPPQ